MFRRKEDGSEELISENDTAYTPAAANANNAPAATAPAPSAPSAPVAAAPASTAPAAQPAPAFRPVPPQAAMAAARMGLKTALITMNLDLIAQMSCNPAIGGVAKGHLVREVDALGGVMGEVADAVGIQFRLPIPFRRLQTPRLALKGGRAGLCHQIFLGVEIGVEAAMRQAGRLHDIGHLDAVEAMPPKPFGSRRQQFLPIGLDICFGCFHVLTIHDHYHKCNHDNYHVK